MSESSSPSSRSARPLPVVLPSDGGRLVPSRWLDEAPVTRMLLALNVAVFFVEAAVSQQFMHLPSRDALALGACYPLAVLGESRYETLLTACFLHDGLAHLGFNMLALWQAGPLVERTIGSGRLAPLYLGAGIFGYVLSVGYAVATYSGAPSLGASGAITGIVAAALVLSWRAQGWRGPLTQAMFGWLSFVLVIGVLSRLGGGRTDNAAHVGGALAGAAIAWFWRPRNRLSSSATVASLAACGALLVLCVSVVAIHDRTDPFASMMLQDRVEFTREALEQGRCSDAQQGLLAVERLRARLAPVTSLRNLVETTCGHTGDR